MCENCWNAALHVEQHGPFLHDLLHHSNGEIPPRKTESLTQEQSIQMCAVWPDHQQRKLWTNQTMHLISSVGWKKILLDCLDKNPATQQKQSSHSVAASSPLEVFLSTNLCSLCVLVEVSCVSEIVIVISGLKEFGFQLASF